MTCHTTVDDAAQQLPYTVRPTPSPVGSWVVTAYAVGGVALVPVNDGSVTLAFDATSVSGTAGCNGFRGSLLLDGSTLAIGPLLSTKMACEPAAVMTRETAVMADLEASTALRPGADGGIELLDATGALALVLAPAMTAAPSASAAPAGSPAA